MDTDAGVEPEQHPEIAAFWNLARFHGRLNTLPTYFGPTPLESLPPPAWSFDDDATLLQLLERGSTTLTGSRADYGDELPEVGTLGIVCDATGRPRALVGTTGVVVGDDQVSEELSVVWAPGE